MINRQFWQGKRIFLTGHTGFKGSWLSLWLSRMGAQVTGYSLDPPTQPSLYQVARVQEVIHRSHIQDIRDAPRLQAALQEARPEMVFHLAAQPLVRESYLDPVETYSVNVMGTLILLEAVRKTPGVRLMVNITSDKCYENREWAWGYRENEAMGGWDPYSSSKGCAELLTASYRRSYFLPQSGQPKPVLLASARAGNVIGGGDWANDRLVPDVMRALMDGREVLIRNPRSIRPWQHVLDPLSGYLTLAQALDEKEGTLADGWNFGPESQEALDVEQVVRQLCVKWGGGAGFQLDQGVHPHEAHYLKLDCSKARDLLGWRPGWNIDQGLEATVEWTRAYQNQQDMRAFTQAQIDTYMDIG